MDWSDLNARYVFPARRHLLGGRLAQGEELLRRGLEETEDGWLAYQLAEAIVWLSPDESGRLQEACSLYEQAGKKLNGPLHRDLAEAALMKAQTLLAMAPKREAKPKSLLPSPDSRIQRRPPPRPAPIVEEEAAPPDPLLEKLKSAFGFEAFRPGQREIVDALLKGKNVLAVLPPGSGRSFVCDFSAQMIEGRTVRISPEPLEGTNSKIVPLIPTGSLPEGERVGLAIVDQAHAVSDWSHDFRFDYSGLRETVSRMAPGRILALTPMATPRVRIEIEEKLGLTAAYVYVGSFDRRHLVWSVIETNDRMTALKGVLAEQAGSAVVRVNRREDAENASRMLEEAGIPAIALHEGMVGEERTHALEEWRADRLRVLVVKGPAKLEKKNIRAVVHWQMPACLESYYLEAVEAGRDGATAQCVLLHAPEDRAFYLGLIEKAYPERGMILRVLEEVTDGAPYSSLRDIGGEVLLEAALDLLEQQGYVRRTGPQQVERMATSATTVRLDTSDVERKRRQAEERLRIVDRYAEARGCRRMEMLQYFGERIEAGWQCGGCDRCRIAREGAAPDGGVTRSAVVMGVRELEGRRFSISEMARAILFLAPPHVTRPLKGKTEAEVRDLINALLREGAIELDGRAQFVRSKR